MEDIYEDDEYVEADTLERLARCRGPAWEVPYIDYWEFRFSESEERNTESVIWEPKHDL